LYFLAAAAAQSNLLPAPAQAWPSERPGRVVSSPNWSDYQNYPIDARRNEVEGTVRFSLLIDPSGKAMDCAVLTSSGSVSLDSATCGLAMRMQFEPARDEEGKALASTYTTKVIWLLDDPRPFTSSALDVVLVYDGDKLTDCKAQGYGPYLELWKSFVCQDAKHYPKKFASKGGLPANVALSVRLDAGDGAMSNPAWPKGRMLTRDQISFAINSEGDATDCSTEADGDIFGNDFRSQSPCGRYLSTIWFEEADKDVQRPRGQFELRLIDRGKE